MNAVQRSMAREKIGGEIEECQAKMDWLAVEEPLEISLSYHNERGERIRDQLLITMRTPGDDEVLILGILFCEGIIASEDQIKKITFIKEQHPHLGDTRRALVALKSPFERKTLLNTRKFISNASCGVCGKTCISDIEMRKSQSLIPARRAMLPPETVILKLPEKVKARQKLFELTGGVHSSALFNEQGDLLDFKEDIGRHNALDKLIGAGLKNKQLPFQNSILFLSGRISFELIQKSIYARIPTIVAFGAPSSMACDLAAKYKINLIGFLKKHQYNIYRSL